MSIDASHGRTPILVRTDLTTAELAGLAASAGVLTARGGRTSHAAVVARQLNNVCIVGCRDLVVIPGGRRGCRIGGLQFAEGDDLPLDGHSGNVYGGRLDVVVERPSQYLLVIRSWKARQRERLASGG